MVKDSLAELLQRFGMLPYVEQLKNLVCLFRYAHKRQIAIEINGSTVNFCTEDGYSKKLFFTKRGGLDLFEPTVAEALAQKAMAARVFADVGAHVGYYSCIAGVVNPNLRIFSFEMNHNLIGIIQKNLAANRIQGATVVHGAVSDTAGRVFYRSGTFTSGERMRYLEETRAAGKYLSCDTLTLDDYFAARDVFPDLLKIDVEGAESKVLRGASYLLAKVRPVIFVEVHPANLTLFKDRCEAVIRSLKKHQYDIKRMRLVRQSRVANSTGVESRDADSPLCQDNEMLLCTPGVMA